MTGAGAAAVAAAIFIHQFVAARQGLDCRDFDNTTWTGTPAATRIARDVTSARFITVRADDRDRFSTECSGWFFLETPAKVTFVVGSDDGALLTVDGGRFVDNSGAHLMRYVSGQGVMMPGPHAIGIQYAQEGGEYGFVLLHSRDEQMPGPLSPWMISRQPLTRAEHLLVRHSVTLRVILAILGILLLVIANGGSLANGSRTLLRRVRPWHDAALKSPTRVAGILLVIAVVARTMVALTSGSILWPDSAVYYQTALAYVRGDWGFHEIVRTPAYPAFLALFLSGGETPQVAAAVTLVQHLLGVLGTLVVFSIGRQWLSTATAFYGALLWSVSPLQLYSERVIQTEVLFTVLLMLSLWLTIRAATCRPSAITFITLGALYGATTLTRPVGKGLIVVILAFFCWQLRQHRVKAVLLTLGAYLVMVVPWMYLNSQTYGFFGINRGEGQGLYFRAFDIERLPSPEPTAFPVLREARAELETKLPIVYYRMRDELDYHRGYSAFQTDQLMRGFAFEAIARHPISFTAGLAHDWLLLFIAPYRTVDICRDDPDGPYLCASTHRQMSLPGFPNQPPARRTALKQAAAAYIDCSYLVLRLAPPLALIGAILSMRQAPNISALSIRMLLFIVTCYFTALAVSLSTVYDRLRLPVDPILMLFAAAACAAPWTSRAGGERGID